LVALNTCLKMNKVHILRPGRTPSRTVLTSGVIVVRGRQAIRYKSSLAAQIDLRFLSVIRIS
jgi:hypothetical protein